ncbi:MAG: hypothetical protein HYS12_17685 [Planctomycetes bacterium]|nr:hypothetical protein [Planctomycetota bacterium]
MAFPREPEVDIPTADVSAWFGVRTGLKVQVVAHAALAGGLSLLLLLFLIALAVESSRRGSGADIGTFEMILTLLAGLALLTGWILNSVAGCFLLGTPSRRSARGLSVGVLLMNTLILLQLAQVGRLLLVGDLDPGGRTAGIVPALDRRGREAASLAASGFFFFFEVTRLTLMALLLRAMCLNLRQARLGANAQLLVLLTPSIMLGTLALTFLVMIATTPGVAVRTILVFLFLGGWIGVLVFGVIVMLGLKQKLDRKLPSTEPA